MRGRVCIPGGAAAALAIAAVAIAAPATAVFAHPSRDRSPHGNAISHVLLILVDGLHQSDVEWYVSNHPG